MPPIACSAHYMHCPTRRQMQKSAHKGKDERQTAGTSNFLAIASYCAFSMAIAASSFWAFSIVFLAAVSRFSTELNFARIFLILGRASRFH